MTLQVFQGHTEWNRSMKKILLVLLFSICISVPVILPFFHPGYFPTHDGEWAVIRLTDMFRTLRDFQIPARYSGNLNFGYGYPLFNFTYPFPYYLGTLLHFFGFSFVNAIKVIFAGSVVLSAFFMFLASKLLWKNVWAGIISSIFYIYFPYRIVDLYVRGSIGESLSFALFSLLFYLAVFLIKKPSSQLVSCIAISIGILISTHNIMTVLFMPLFVVFVLIQSIFENKKAIKPFLVSLILGFGLSAFFWIPAISEKGNILLSQIPIADRNLYFVDFKQLLFSGWGYGTPTDKNPFTYQIGIAHIATLIVGTLSFLFFAIRDKKYFREYYARSLSMLIIFIGFYVFLLFKQSGFLWTNLPLLSEINYPWIVLGILGFLISLLAGFFSKNVFGRYLMLIFGIITIFIVLPNAKPEKYINYPDSYYLTNDATTTSSDELMPLWVKKSPTRRVDEKAEVISGKGIISEVFSNSKQLDFLVNASTRVDVRINTIYYPGWKIYLDGENVKINYTDDLGVMIIPISSGYHVVGARFGETPLRLVSDILSIVSMGVVVLLIVKRKWYEIS